MQGSCVRVFSVVLISAGLAGCGGGSGSSSGSSADHAVQCIRTEAPSISDAPAAGPAVGGLIQIEAYARADHDSADLLAEFGQERLEVAQQLPPAVILGGYISASDGVYEDDFEHDFRHPRDPVDRYCIDLQPGQAVEAEFFNPTRGQSLALLRVTDGEVIQRAGFDSEPEPGESRKQRLQLADDAPAGTYGVEVRAPESAPPSRYVLASSASAHAQALPLDWPDPEFVPGQAIVTLDQSRTTARAAATSTAAMALERDLGAGQYQVSLAGTRLHRQSAPTSALARQQETIEWIRALRQRPEVASAAPNYRVRGMASAAQAVGEPLYPDQWHYPLINLPQAWQLAPGGGAGVRVAVLDTGLFQDGSGAWHEDLVDSLPPGCAGCWDFVADSALPLDRSRDPDGDPSGPWGSVYHGTHVAGTIAASGSNRLGGTGVAPGAELLPMRVLDENGAGDLGDVIEAINRSIAEDVDVINLSLGSSADTEPLRDAVNRAVANGILIAAAAGNNPTGEKTYPAALEQVFAVGAVDGAGNLASYSSRGNWVDLVAPGGDASRDANQDGRADMVISTSGDPGRGSGYAGLQGTSMATPHVSGVFALLKALGAESGQAVDTAVIRGSLPDMTSGPRGEGYGAGLLDAARAVELIGSGNLALLSPEARLLELSREDGEQTLGLTRVGDPGIDIAASDIAVESDAAWLAGGDARETPTGFEIPLEVDQRALEPDRSYRAGLTVSYPANGRLRSFEVAITVPVSSTVAGREAGVHFVLMVGRDEAFNAQTTVSPVDGNYRFRFGVTESVSGKALNQVVVGHDYWLVAGSDLDNDGVICTAGEACAEYPVAGLREQVTVVEVNGEYRLQRADGEILDGDELVMTTSFSRPVTARSLPRPGFSGYKLLDSAGSPGTRRLPDSQRPGTSLSEHH